MSPGAAQMPRPVSLKWATVHPTEMLSAEPLVVSAGIQKANGEFSRDSILRRDYSQGTSFETTFPEPVEKASAFLDRGFYAGTLDDRFGHFLLESLSRLASRHEHRDRVLVWSVGRNRRHAGYIGWQREIIDLLGVDGPCLMAGVPIRVADLFVPPPGYVIQNSFCDEHARFLARVPWRPTRGAKLWLSRRDVPRRAHRGLNALEDVLSGQGWRVVQPEKLSVAEQLRLYASAERIAGQLGSALHSLILLAGTEGLRVDGFVANPLGSEATVNRNYITIAEAKRFSQRIHFVALDSQVDDIPGFTERMMALLDAR
jgi:capsular polysaccharide biosynthesis protein